MKKKLSMLFVNLIVLKVYEMLYLQTTEGPHGALARKRLQGDQRGGNKNLRDYEKTSKKASDIIYKILYLQTTEEILKKYYLA